MNRQLTEEEKELTQKNVQRLQEQNDWWTYCQKVVQLDLDIGLRLKYEKAMREQQQQLKQLTKEIGVNEEVIKTSTKSLTEGVRDIIKETDHLFKKEKQK